ncbi:hypothetical protein N9Y17_03085 [Gammaproteobacteria bacterium]|nr:hypothetical protein [Gammaproteobacteria bacterium]
MAQIKYFNYPNLYLDNDGKIHILVPIVGGDRISTDNTCKGTLALQSFFTASKSASSVDWSEDGELQKSLRKLQKDLDGDLSQLPIETRESLKSQCQKLLEEVDKIKGSDEFKNTFFPRIKSLKTYPDSMQQLIKNSKNITTISMRPAVDDPFPRFDKGYLNFNVNRRQASWEPDNQYADISGPNSALALGLRTKLTNIQIGKPDLALQVMQKMQDGGIQERFFDHLDDQQFRDAFKRAITDVYGQQIGWPEKDTQLGGGPVDKDYFSSILMYDQQTIDQDIIQSLIDSSILPPSKSIDFEKLSTDWRSLCIQLYLAHISTYAKVHKASTQDLAQNFENNATQRNALIQKVTNSLSDDGTFQKSVLDYCNKTFGLNLSDEDRKQVDDMFFQNFTVINGHDHPDEFLLLHQKKGGAYSYQGNIRVLFKTFCEKVLNVNDSIQVDVNDLADEVRNGIELLHRKRFPGQADQRLENVDISSLMVSDPADLADLLATKDDNKFLYESKLADWPQHLSRAQMAYLVNLMQPKMTPQEYQSFQDWLGQQQFANSHTHCIAKALLIKLGLSSDQLKGMLDNKGINYRLLFENQDGDVVVDLDQLNQDAVQKLLSARKIVRNINSFNISNQFNWNDACTVFSESAFNEQINRWTYNFQDNYNFQAIIDNSNQVNQIKNNFKWNNPDRQSIEQTINQLGFNEKLSIRYGFLFGAIQDINDFEKALDEQRYVKLMCDASDYGNQRTALIEILAGEVHKDSPNYKFYRFATNLQSFGNCQQIDVDAIRFMFLLKAIGIDAYVEKKENGNEETQYHLKLKNKDLAYLNRELTSRTDNRLKIEDYQSTYTPIKWFEELTEDKRVKSAQCMLPTLFEQNFDDIFEEHHNIASNAFKNKLQSLNLNKVGDLKKILAVNQAVNGKDLDELNINQLSNDEIEFLQYAQYGLIADSAKSDQLKDKYGEVSQGLEEIKPSVFGVDVSKFFDMQEKSKLLGQILKPPFVGMKPTGEDTSDIINHYQKYPTLTALKNRNLNEIDDFKKILLVNQAVNGKDLDELNINQLSNDEIKFLQYAQYGLIADSAKSEQLKDKYGEVSQELKKIKPSIFGFDVSKFLDMQKKSILLGQILKPIFVGMKPTGEDKSDIINHYQKCPTLTALKNLIILCIIACALISATCLYLALAIYSAAQATMISLLAASVISLLGALFFGGHVFSINQACKQCLEIIKPEGQGKFGEDQSHDNEAQYLLDRSDQNQLGQSDQNQLNADLN